eukprot:TRINITY_DN4296_c6_g1_i1.p1 TRINITY_DN4296_c6_g1~~TRINITY_DN4296_c6_g1_i1.p1  ORF type:complete len:1021 (+),score=388.84 TRINITY_DN4296_c6_g1_i1:299-3064(+)
MAALRVEGCADRMNNGVVQPLDLTLRGLGQWSDCAEVNRLAYAASAGDLALRAEVGERLFTSLLSVRDYAEMQKLALQEFTRTKDAAYSFSGIIAMLLQVPADPPPQHLHLTLAGRMLEKRASEGICKSQQLVALRVEVLLMKGDTDGVLQLLASEELADAMILEEVRMGFALRAFARAGDTLRRNALLKQLLSSERVPVIERQNWRWWREYFATLEEIVGAGSACDGLPDLLLRHGAEPLKMKPDTSLAQAAQFVASVQIEDDKPALRATALAHVHLTHMRRAEDGGMQALVAAILGYLRRYRFKQQPSLDVLQYLESVAEAGAGEDLCREIRAGGGEEGQRALRRQLCADRVACSVVTVRTAEEVTAEVARLLKTSAEAVAFDDAGDPGEASAGDDAVIAACNLLLRRYVQTRDLTWLVHVLLLLEGSPRPASNSSLQLWRMCGWAAFGVPRPDVVQQLDVKSIQNESLSYLQLGAVLRSGVDKRVTEVCGRVVDNSQRLDADHGKMMMPAWQGAFVDKVLDGERFRSHLQRSANVAECMLELAALALSREHGQSQQCARQYTASAAFLRPLAKVENALEMAGGLTSTEDTSCVAQTIWTPPTSAVGKELLEALLQGTPVAASLPDRTALVKARLLELRSVAAALQLGAAKGGGGGGGGGGGKKGKKDKRHVDPVPQGPDASELWRVVRETGEAASAAADAVDPASLQYRCSSGCAEVCLKMTAAAHRVGPAAATDSTAGAAEALVRAIEAAAAFGGELASLWHQGKLTRICDMVHILRQHTPLAVLHVGAVASNSPGARAALREAGAAEALKRLAAAVEDAGGAAEDLAGWLLPVSKQRPGSAPTGRSWGVLAAMTMVNGGDLRDVRAASEPWPVPLSEEVTAVSGRAAGAMVAALRSVAEDAKDRVLSIRALAQAVR